MSKIAVRYRSTETHLSEESSVGPCFKEDVQAIGVDLEAPRGVSSDDVVVMNRWPRL